MFGVQFFIDKFSAIPSNQWCTGKFENDRGQKCVLGHVGWKIGETASCYEIPEALFLVDLFERAGAHISNVNDGLKVCTKNPRIRQIIAENKKPKDRIIKTLEYIRAKNV